MFGQNLLPMGGLLSAFTGAPPRKPITPSTVVNAPAPPVSAFMSRFVAGVSIPTKPKTFTAGVAKPPSSPAPVTSSQTHGGLVGGGFMGGVARGPVARLY